MSDCDQEDDDVPNASSVDELCGSEFPPQCLELWQMIYTPLQSLYLNLANGYDTTDGLLRSIITSCEAYKDILVPKEEGPPDDINFTDFTIWLMGRLFYLMICEELLPLVNISIAAQVEILKLLQVNRNRIFQRVSLEYALILLDTSNAEQLFEHNLQLNRFIPRFNSYLAQFIDLTQVPVIVNSISLRCIFQYQALKILKGVIMVLTEQDTYLIVRIWQTLRTAYLQCYFHLQVFILDNEMAFLQRGFFMSDHNAAKDYCNQFYCFVGSSNKKFLKLEFPFKDHDILCQEVKKQILKIKESSITGDELLASILFEAMKNIVSKWKDNIFTDDVADTAARLAIFILKKYKNLIVGDNFIFHMLGQREASLNLIHLMEWCAYEELVTFLTRLGSSLTGSVTAFQEYPAKDYERFGEIRNSNLFKTIVHQYFQSQFSRDTEQKSYIEVHENVDVHGKVGKSYFYYGKPDIGSCPDGHNISDTLSPVRKFRTESMYNQFGPAIQPLTKDSAGRVVIYPLSGPSDQVTDNDSDISPLYKFEKRKRKTAVTSSKAKDDHLSSVGDMGQSPSHNQTKKLHVTLEQTPVIHESNESTETDDSTSNDEILVDTSPSKKDDDMSPLVYAELRLTEFYNTMKEKHEEEKRKQETLLKQAHSILTEHGSLEEIVPVVDGEEDKSKIADQYSQPNKQEMEKLSTPDKAEVVFGAIYGQYKRRACKLGSAIKSIVKSKAKKSHTMKASPKEHDTKTTKKMQPHKSKTFMNVQHETRQKTKGQDKTDISIQQETKGHYKPNIFAKIFCARKKIKDAVQEAPNASMETEEHSSAESEGPRRSELPLPPLPYNTSVIAAVVEPPRASSQTKDSRKFEMSAGSKKTQLQSKAYVGVQPSFSTGESISAALEAVLECKPLPSKKVATTDPTEPSKEVEFDTALQGQHVTKNIMSANKEQEGYDVKQDLYALESQPGSSRDPDYVEINIQEGGESRNRDGVQYGVLSKDGLSNDYENDIFIYSYMASITWYNLLLKMESHLTDLPYVVESSKVNIMLEEIEKIIYCSLELSLMLENNFDGLTTWSRYRFIFFNKVKIQMTESFSQLFVQLSGELGQEAIISKCLNLVGSIFHMSEIQRASYCEIKDLATFVALPWMDEFEEDRCLGSALIERCFENTSLRGIKLKCLSFGYLVYLPHCEENQLMWRILDYCLSDIELMVMVVNSSPVLILEKKLEPSQFFSDFMYVVFDESVIHPSLQLAASALAGKTVCALAGRCISSRDVVDDEVIFKSECVDCSHLIVTGPQIYKNQMEGFNSFVERYLQFLNSTDCHILNNMINCLENFSRHIPNFTSSGSMKVWFKLITDSDEERRLKFSSLVPYVIFDYEWMQKKRVDMKDSAIDSRSMSRSDKNEITRAKPLLKECIHLLNSMTLSSIKNEDVMLQRSLILTISSLGSVPVDCVLLPSVMLLFMFILDPKSMNLPVALRGFNKIAEVRGKSALQIYTRFKRELCNIITDVAVLNHIHGTASFSTSIQRVARALGFQNVWEFLHKDSHHILPYLLPAVMKCNQAQKLLKELGQTISVDMKVLMEKTFQYIYPHVFLNHDEKVRESCFNYIEEVTETSLINLRLANFKMIHNEVLLRFHENPDQALAALCQFAHDDGDYIIETEPMSLLDIASYLSHRFLGVMVYFDSKLLSMKTADNVKISVLKSLPQVTRLMGKKYITAVRFKVLATLRTAMTIDINIFPSLCIEAWKAFVECVHLSHLGPLLTTIFASLLPLSEDFRTEVSEIINYLIHEDKQMVGPYLNSIYFIEEYEQMKCLNVNQVENDTGSMSFMKKLEVYTNSVKSDNTDIKRYGLKYLKSLLLENPSSIHECLKMEEHVHPGLRQALDALFEASNDDDYEIRVSCIECIGLIGAVDPSYLVLREFERGTVTLPSGITDGNFCVAVLQHLAKQFQSSRHTQSMDAYALGMQLFLQKFNVSPEPEFDSYEVWKKLAPELKEVVGPFLTSCYRNSVPEYEDYPHPIIGSEYGRTFSDWARSWTLKMLDKLVFTDVKKIFEFCIICMRRDLQTLLFFMPYIFVYALESASEIYVGQILEEISTILSLAKEDHTPLPSFDSMKFGIAHPLTGESSVGLNEKDQVMCAKQVFSLIDFTYQYLRTSFSRIAGNEDTDHTLKSLKGFLDQLDMLQLSKANYLCGENTRALLYLENYVRRHPEGFQNILWLFLKLYVRLNDPDGVVGVAALRENEPTLEETMMAHKATGQLQDLVTSIQLIKQFGDVNAAVFYENLEFETSVGANFYTGLVECYLALDQPVTAVRICQGVMKERPELVSIMEDFEAEAFWRLGDFDQLSNLLQTTSISENKSWNICLGHVLTSFRDEVCNIASQLNIMKTFAIDSMDEVSIEKGSYTEQYATIVRAHIIMEIEKFHNALQSLMQKETAVEALSLAAEVMEDWSCRLQAVKPCTSFREPIFSVRRAFLLQAMEITHSKFPVISEYFMGQVGKCWLESAITAMSDHQFQQAYAYILNAEKFKVKGLFVEKARLLWAKGDQEMAVSELKRGIETFIPFEFENMTEYYANVPQEDQVIYAKAKLQLATYLDETVYVDVETSIDNYKDAVAACRSMERSYVCVAQYFERLMASYVSDATKYVAAGGETQIQIVKYYANSLLHGNEYLHQSLPCLLTVWFDYGTQLGDQARLKRYTEADRLQMTQNLNKMNTTIDHLFDALPPFLLMPAFSQLISRIGHPHQQVFYLLLKILSTLIKAYPQQAMWMTIPVYKSSNAFRCRRCKQVVDTTIRDSPNTSAFMRDFIMLAEKLTELTDKPIDEATKRTGNITLQRLSRTLPKLLENSQFSKIILPLQQSFTISLPRNRNEYEGHIPYAGNMVCFSRIKDNVLLLPSLQQPKRIVVVGTDGKEYSLMCKSRDDLRRDFRYMEFSNVVNQYLRKEAESKQRNLQIRTYCVMPLNDDSGIVEWVPDLKSYRQCLIELYKESKLFMGYREAKKFLDPVRPLEEKRKGYLEKVLPLFPPIFDEWFTLKFPEPHTWYRARTSYIRTTAVMSMVGFILGLGDRHGENILMDTVTGEAIHVDFNCLFNKGETFQCPELVPFRLTHNMIAAMGPLGVEGTYRKCCEITLRILRKHSQTLLSFLRPFIYDPMVSWIKPQPDGDVEYTNEMAVRNLQGIKRRLDGLVKIKGKECILEISAEGQVNYLIIDATDVDNLCQMYVGWGPFL